MEKENKIKIFKIVFFIVLLILVILFVSNEYLKKSIYIIIYLLVGFDVLKNAIYSIKNKKVFNESFPNWRNL